MRTKKRAAQTAALDDIEVIRGSDDDESSQITGFGSTAEAFFEGAWRYGAEQPETPEIDARYQQFSSEERDDDDPELRLDRFARRADQSFRRTRIVAIVALLVAVGVGGWLFFSNRATDLTQESRIEDSFVQGLGSLGDPRSYVAAAPNELRNGSALAEQFRLSASGDLERVGPATSGIQFVAVQWGGRMNVAVIGAGVGSPESCVVATLVDEDLRTVDVAANGSTCHAAFAPTGDRTSCVSSDLVLIELWPVQESLDSPAGVPKDLRVRVIDNDGGSERGAVAVSQLGTLAELQGEPGDSVTVASSGVSGTCELIDRSDVPVQLL